ncbi:MAG: EAL domain-containing protein [Rhodoferax sp.]|uniref:bifunctional diguanylate cyclase/phosphodiesterase n=1 Tax=Rhodoferax sp. TaxID=50421 RepID=UPI00260E7943|nr:EAL domain-containing protein [Rhodoferax sp.]MDD2882199.1 EAL domain-containing protein [Rhodoferax sp.]
MLTQWRFGKFAAAVVTLILISMTFVLWSNKAQESSDTRDKKFSQVADYVADRLQHRANHFELVLRGVKGFLEGSEQITRAEYKAYFDSLRLDTMLPGLQAVSVSAHVAQADLTNHLATQQLQYPNYQIKPAVTQALHAPIVLIAPYTGVNVNAIGFDTATNPLIKPVLERARDSGEVALTGRLGLVQDTGQNRPASVMYVPTYRQGVPLATASERQAALSGWVGAVFRIDDLVTSLRLDPQLGVRFDIYDGPVALPTARMYGQQTEVALTATALSATRTLEIGGKQWQLTFHSLPAFDAQYSAKWAYGPMAALGVAFSLLVGWLIALLSSRQERAVSLARDMTQELRTMHADMEATLNAMPDVLFELGLDGRYHRYRTTQMSSLAVPPDFLLGHLIAEVLPAPATATCLAALQEAHATGLSLGKQIEIPIGGTPTWFEVSVARKQVDAGAEPRFVMISRDITERKRLEAQLRLSAQVFDSSHDGIVITDQNNRVLSVNRSFTDITGYSLDDVLGRGPHLLAADEPDGHFDATMQTSLQTTGYWQGEVTNRRKNGDIYPQWLSISVVRDSSAAITHYICMLSDLSTKKQTQARIDYLSHYDTLTQLPNHRMLQDLAKLALASAHSEQSSAALMFIDIDHFQTINDSLGRPVGDSILKTMALRLSAQLQSNDSVCRQGGDEFMVLLTQTDAEEAAHVATRMLALMHEPVVLGTGQELNLTGSIGIAMYPDNGHDLDRLSQCADAALLQAKQNGRNQFKFFTEQMHERAREMLLVENHLRRAMARGELLLHYQPQVDAVTSRIIGAEALIRWQHPEWGLVSPMRFIPIAESSGQILQIGEWVLRAATQQVADWQAAGLPVVPVAVNLSALQFRQATLCDTVSEALSASGVAPNLLELELTESIAMEDSGFTLDQISRLHAMGITLSIDDFGTGYSSLSYLKRYQIDKLKIDQSFVRDLDSGTDDGSLVRAIIHMAHSMGFKTIAEGVETQAQLDALRADGCDEIQGYFFSRPVPAEAFAQLLLRPTLSAAAK